MVDNHAGQLRWGAESAILSLMSDGNVPEDGAFRRADDAHVKTDKHDAWALARLLVADLIPQGGR